MNARATPPGAGRAAAASGRGLPARRTARWWPRAAVLALLLAGAVLTLVPFAYLLTSSVRSRVTYFSSPFLPRGGLFEMEASTGSITLLDTSHLDTSHLDTSHLDTSHLDTSHLERRDADLRGDGAAYELRVAMIPPGEARPAAEAAVTAVVTRVPDPGPKDPALHVSLRDGSGRPIATVRDAFASPPAGARYAIARGNPRGRLGVAWGQLTSSRYRQLLDGSKRPNFLDFTWNSVFYASVTAVLATLSSAMAGYALARFNFPGRRLVTGVVLASLVVPSSLLLAPTYQLVYRLGMLDSFAGLVLPGLAPAFGVFLFRQAVSASVPAELLEAARLDGSGEGRLFFAVALPLLRPMVGAFLLVMFLGAWNAYLWPQLVLPSPHRQPLAVATAQLRDFYSVDFGLIMAATVLSVAPVVTLFLVLQRDFISGLTAGAMKG